MLVEKTTSQLESAFILRWYSLTRSIDNEGSRSVQTSAINPVIVLVKPASPTKKGNIVVPVDS